MLIRDTMKGGCLVAGLAAVLLAGCQAKTRPFEDVAGRQKNMSSDDQVAQAPAPAPQPVQVTPAPQAAPVAQKPAPQPAEVSDAPAAPVAVMAPATAATINTPSTANAVTVKVRDGGVLRRPWPISVAWQPSGDVMTGPVYYPSAGITAKYPDWQEAWIDPADFFLYTALLPINVFRIAPWDKVVYSEAGNKDGWREVDQAGFLYMEKDSK